MNNGLCFAALQNGSSPTLGLNGDRHFTVPLDINYKAHALRQNGISSALEGAADDGNRCGRRKQCSQHCRAHSHFAAMTDATDTIAAMWRILTRLHRHARKINSDYVLHNP